MKHVCKKVYGLWDSVQDMAVDLNESPSALEKSRKANVLPDTIHDRNIIIRAMFVGSMLTNEHLKNHRMKGESQ